MPFVLGVLFSYIRPFFIFLRMRVFVSCWFHESSCRLQELQYKQLEQLLTFQSRITSFRMKWYLQIGGWGVRWPKTFENNYNNKYNKGLWVMLLEGYIKHQFATFHTSVDGSNTGGKVQIWIIFTQMLCVWPVENSEIISMTYTINTYVVMAWRARPLTKLSTLQILIARRRTLTEMNTERVRWHHTFYS